MFAKENVCSFNTNFVVFVKYLQILICHHLPHLTAIANSQNLLNPHFFLQVLQYYIVNCKVQSILSLLLVYLFEQKVL